MPVTATITSSGWAYQRPRRRWRPCRPEPGPALNVRSGSADMAAAEDSREIAGGSGGERARSDNPEVSGTLFVVGTPIGNMEDLTPRARRVMSEVDVVVCEDTRRTGALLDRKSTRLNSSHQ